MKNENNKGRNKHQQPDSSMHDNSTQFPFTKNMSYKTFVLSFKILSTVLPSESLTQIVLCITLETEMENEPKETEGKKKHIFGFLSLHISGHSQCVCDI